MECLGQFKKDRTCELCAICNNQEYNQCKQLKQKREELIEEANNIRCNCPYASLEWDRDTHKDFWGCEKDGKYPSDLMPYCYPSQRCRQYAKQ